MSEPELLGKSHDIPKRLVWDAWLKVKENGGAAGVDGVTIGGGVDGQSGAIGAGGGTRRAGDHRHDSQGRSQQAMTNSPHGEPVSRFT